MTFRQEKANDLTPREAMRIKTSRLTRSSMGGPDRFPLIFFALEVQLGLDADRVQLVVGFFQRRAFSHCLRRTRQCLKKNGRRQEKSQRRKRGELNFSLVLANSRLAPGAARARDGDRA